MPTQSTTEEQVTASVAPSSPEPMDLIAEISLINSSTGEELELTLTANLTVPPRLLPMESLSLSVIHMALRRRRYEHLVVKSFTLKEI